MTEDLAASLADCRAAYRHLLANSIRFAGRFEEVCDERDQLAARLAKAEADLAIFTSATIVFKR